MKLKLKTIKHSGYKLKDSETNRRKALVTAIHNEAKIKNVSLRVAAIKKKARLNVLRIYRKNEHKQECKIITRDMIFITKKFLKIGTVKHIC